jgi:polyphosphate glucokinase
MARRGPARVGRRPSPSAPRGPRTLAVDVGGTAIKVVVLDARGRPVSTPARAPTPRPATPAAVLAAVARLARDAGPYDRVSVGFPGALRAGRVETAPNLDGRAWRGLRLAARFSRVLGRPARVANDAIVQGLGAVRGRGVELVLTLGTGLGSALFVDGRPVPLEAGHLPWRRGRTYEEALGEASRRRVGDARWRARVRDAVASLRAAFRPDVVHVGGGNSARLGRSLDRRARRVDNVAGLLGGFRLWSSDRRAGSGRSSACADAQRASGSQS